MTMPLNTADLMSAALSQDAYGVILFDRLYTSFGLKTPEYKRTGDIVCAYIAITPKDRPSPNPLFNAHWYRDQHALLDDIDAFHSFLETGLIAGHLPNPYAVTELETETPSKAQLLAYLAVSEPVA